MSRTNRVNLSFTSKRAQHGSGLVLRGFVLRSMHRFEIQFPGECSHHLLEWTLVILPAKERWWLQARRRRVFLGRILRHAGRNLLCAHQGTECERQQNRRSRPSSKIRTARHRALTPGPGRPHRPRERWEQFKHQYGWLSVHAGLRQSVFRVNQNSLNDEAFDEKDFRGRSHFHAFRHPNPIVQPCLLHRNVRATQHACQK